MPMPHPLPRPATSATGGLCHNRHCQSPIQPLADDSTDTYCTACGDLADEHDEGGHDYDSREYCPACQPT